MNAILALLLFVGGPLTGIYLLNGLAKRGRVAPTKVAKSPGPNQFLSGLKTLFRHPIKFAAGLLAGTVGIFRRSLSRLEVALNLIVVSETVEEKREQCRSIEQLLSNIADIGLKPETIEALRAKISETATNADGLEEVSAGFSKQLETLRKKENELATLQLVASKVKALGLQAEAAADIEDRLREVGNAVEVERVKLAQQIEYVAQKAART